MRRYGAYAQALIVASWIGLLSAISLAGDSSTSGVVGDSVESGLPLAGGTLTGMLTLPTGAEGSLSVAFGDGDSGFFEETDDEISVAIAGTERFLFSGNVFTALTAGSGGMRNVASTATVPSILSDYADINSGLTHPGDDQVGLVAGGVSAFEATETGSAITQVLIQIPQGSAGSCAVGEVFIDLDVTEQLCVCTAADTWKCATLAALD